jgi:hypothetical protein
MKKHKIMETKKKYITPEVEEIRLDNAISLALESTPPVGPDETSYNFQSPLKEETGLV